MKCAFTERQQFLRKHYCSINNNGKSYTIMLFIYHFLCWIFLLIIYYTELFNKYIKVMKTESWCQNKSLTLTPNRKTNWHTQNNLFYIGWFSKNLLILILSDMMSTSARTFFLVPPFIWLLLWMIKFIASWIPTKFRAGLIYSNT